MTIMYLELDHYLVGLISWQQFCWGNFRLQNNLVDNNSLLWLPEVILSTCITYEQNYIVPSQLSPFFTNPSLHWQLYDPRVFLHSELAIVLHGSSCTHSSISDMREYYTNVIFIHRWNNHRACKVVSADFQSEGEKKTDLNH